MSNGFLTWSAWECGKVGNPEETIGDSPEKSEPSPPGRGVFHHDHDRLEESVDGRPEAQKVP
jgi:hypothetical protein